MLDLGPQYRSWITHIHDYYKPPKDNPGTSKARQRAAGWRCAQALQWAVSSPHAGMGYLVRQAVRAGWDLSDMVLREAIAGLRPYRLGNANEPIDTLFNRIVAEVVRERQERDVEDIEDDVDNDATEGLSQLIEEGLAVMANSADDKWDFIRSKVLDVAGGDKVVLFAQPIETVIALGQYLERTYKRKPAFIIGGQSDGERQGQVESFRRSNGPQYLVSSRAGGEGINLQVARRLVHVDTPWNPMDLEQRVGRVHRFGSREKILVDTVVVKDSREADAYRIARQKLELIAATMVEPERFEATFSRVMCLVPPEELQSLMIKRAQAPFSTEDQEQLAHMVRQGFNAWKDFHEKYGKQQKDIRQQDPGLATWDDLSRFLEDYAGARQASGFRSIRFVIGEGGSTRVERDASVLAADDGNLYLCEESIESLVDGPPGLARPRQLGLNLPFVAALLRKCAFPRLEVGAAHLRWHSEAPCVTPFGILVFLRQTVRTDQLAGLVGRTEHSNALLCYVIEADKEPVAVEGPKKGTLLRGVFDATIRTKPDVAEGLSTTMKRHEMDLIERLRQPLPTELASGVRHAITPLFSAVVS